MIEIHNYWFIIIRFVYFLYLYGIVMLIFPFLYYIDCKSCKSFWNVILLTCRHMPNMMVKTVCSGGRKLVKSGKGGEQCLLLIVPFKALSHAGFKPLLCLPMVCTCHYIFKLLLTLEHELKYLLWTSFLLTYLSHSLFTGPQGDDISSNYILSPYYLRIFLFLTTPGHSLYNVQLLNMR